MREKNFLISIIVPCYNCSDSIHKTLQSLLNQTIKNFEIIFVNDGSEDNSLNIAEKILIQSGLKYKIINQTNKGVSVARNNGIEVAEGKYLYFLDADDNVSNNFIESILNFDKEDFDICFFNYNIEYNDKIISLGNESKYAICTDSKKDIIKNILNQTFNYHIGSVVIKKEIIKNNKIYFSENCKYGEDQEFVIKSLCSSQNVIVNNINLFNYCMREGSAIHKFPKTRMDSIDCAIRIEKYVEKIYSNDQLILNLSKKYVANQMLHNIREFNQIDRLNVINNEIKYALIDKIKSKRNYFNYLDYNEKKSIKKVLMKKLLKSNLEVYILLHRIISY